MILDWFFEVIDLTKYEKKQLSHPPTQTHTFSHTLILTQAYAYIVTNLSHTRTNKTKTLKLYYRNKDVLSA